MTLDGTVVEVTEYQSQCSCGWASAWFRSWIMSIHSGQDHYADVHASGARVGNVSRVRQIVTIDGDSTA